MDRTLVHRHATGNEVPPPLYRGCTGLRVRRLASAASRSHFARFAVHGTFAGHVPLASLAGTLSKVLGRAPNSGTGPQCQATAALKASVADGFKEERLAASQPPQGRLFQAAPSFNRGFTGGGSRSFGGDSLRSILCNPSCKSRPETQAAFQVQAGDDIAVSRLSPC